MQYVQILLIYFFYIYINILIIKSVYQDLLNICVNFIQMNTEWQYYELKKKCWRFFQKDAIVDGYDTFNSHIFYVVCFIRHFIFNIHRRRIIQNNSIFLF